MTVLHPTNTAVQTGRQVDEAHRAMILLHGRGASAEDILGLLPHLACDDCACIAPRATGNTWYPASFLRPEAENQPHLDAALAAVGSLIHGFEHQGIPPERVFLLGFSQGACLSLELVARNPRRYGGVFALSGGLIGLGANRREFHGDLGGTPIIMGCSDVDPHIPCDRFLASAETLRTLGADVDDVLYPGFGHSVHPDELDRVNRVLTGPPAILRDGNGLTIPPRLDAPEKSDLPDGR